MRTAIGISGLLLLMIFTPGLWAASAPQQPVLADQKLLLEIGAKILAHHDETGVALAYVTPAQKRRLSERAHAEGKCGGFESLFGSRLNLQDLKRRAFGHLTERERTNRDFRPDTFRRLQAKANISSALEQISEKELRTTVEMLSAFKDRYHKGPRRNDGVEALRRRILQSVQGSVLNVEVETVSHTATDQKSLRARILGSTYPSEIIVLGGHLDSINQSWWGTKDAPGADDNASGSANLVEALRILAAGPQPERTIEFYWYAGEEGGLIGSSEIARSYKTQNQDVVAVLQLDMTLFPGDGESVIVLMTDFTSVWLRTYLRELNEIYIKARVLEDKCGYGCSDHASWHRQGYPAAMPAEASFGRINQNLHTSRDVIDSNSSFRHSAQFTKLALALALDLGNSRNREP